MTDEQQDAEAPAVALDRTRARRDELQRLTRNEAAVATGQWYALARLEIDFEELLEALKQRAGASLPENAPSLNR